MATDLHLSDAETQLVLALRALPPELREEAFRYLIAPRRRSPVRPANPVAARQLGEPGQPAWHLDDDELGEAQAFENASDEASVGG